MNVSGLLPKPAETVLTSLLAQYPVNSWKVTSEGQNVVFVLRMASDNLTDNTLPSCQYRRKPPSQVRRDMRRSANRHQAQNNVALQYTTGETNNTTRDNINSNSNDNNSNINSNDNNNNNNSAVGTVSTHTPKSKASDTSNSPCPLFTFTPDSQHEHAVTTPDAQTTRASVSVPTESATTRPTLDAVKHGEDTSPTSDQTSAARADDVTLCLPQMSDSLTVAGEGACTESEEDKQEREYVTKSVASLGYDFEKIKNYVAGIVDRSTQLHLRDKSRNMNFSNVVVDNRLERDIVICESDDYLLRYDRKKQTRTWFVKSAASTRKVSEDIDSLVYAQRASPADQELCRRECDILKSDLECVIRAVRFLLG